MNNEAGIPLVFLVGYIAYLTGHVAGAIGNSTTATIGWDHVKIMFLMITAPALLGYEIGRKICLKDN